MSNIFFTSDLHIGHTNLIKRGVRSEFKDCQHHDETILHNWNSVVGKGDLIYILGDVVWGGDFSLLKKFNGIKIVIKGNHDKKEHLQRAKSEGYVVNWHYYKGITVNKQYIFLCHYPMRSWDRAFHGSWHLFGHVHGTMKDNGYSTDVGVDCWNYKPVSLDQVIEYMRYKREVEGILSPKEYQVKETV